MAKALFIDGPNAGYVMEVPNICEHITVPLKLSMRYYSIAHMPRHAIPVTPDPPDKLDYYRAATRYLPLGYVFFTCSAGGLDETRWNNGMKMLEWLIEDDRYSRDAYHQRLIIKLQEQVNIIDRKLTNIMANHRLSSAVDDVTEDTD